MEYDDVLTRNEDQELAVRVVSATESATVVNPNDIYTRTTEGHLAVRTVGGSGGGGGGSDPHNLGWYATQSALETAHPTAENGDWAIVGATDTVWVWDSDTNAWKDTDQKGQVESVNGKTGAVVLSASDVGALPDSTVIPDAIQYSTMPIASIDNLGDIIQFTGTTDSSYINGYFYKCVSDGQVPATYSWTQVEVQPAGSSLPDQTGQSGKFLTTNGTNASWGTNISGLTVSKTNTNLELVYFDSANTAGLFKAIGSTYYITSSWAHNQNYGAKYLDIEYRKKTNSDFIFGSKIGETEFYVRNSLTTKPTLGTSSYYWSNVYTEKLNNGADINVPAVGGKVALQIDTMPTAASSYEGVIYQYTGATDSTYTNGRFYKCVSDGAVTPTYSWEEVSMGGGSSLPSQTGNAGKFLTTDGTDASWATINALQNTATGNNSLTILGTASSRSSTVNIGVNSKTLSDYAVALGKGASASVGCVAIGNVSVASNYSTAIGSSTGISYAYNHGVAIGYNTAIAANYAIQLGTDATRESGGYSTVNSDANTFKVANANGNFEMMSADGTIPKERLVNAVSKPSTMPELTVAGWSNNTQTVTVTGVTATNTVFVSPAPASASDYASAGIICTVQGTDSLTFTCTTVPTNAITVNVVIMG